MVLVRRRANRLESAISIFLLVALSVIGFGVFLKQSYYDIRRFGINTTASQLEIDKEK